MLKYSPGIALEELSERYWDVWDHSMDTMCTSRRCPMTSHTFSVPMFSSSLEFFLLLHYRQAKCIIYCLTLNPAHVFFFDEKCSDTKIKESVACKQNKTPSNIQLHTPRNAITFIYTKRIIIWQIIASQLCSFSMGCRLLGQ